MDLDGRTEGLECFAGSRDERNCCVLAAVETDATEEGEEEEKAVGLLLISSLVCGVLIGEG